MRTGWTARDLWVTGSLGVVVVAGALLGAGRWLPGGTAPGRTSAGAPALPAATPTPLPLVSEQTKAAAEALLAAGAAQREAGQLGPALELGNQALDTWPQFAAAEQFVAAVVPQATAVTLAGQAQATAAAGAQALVRSAALRAYSTRAQRPLQRYADALGGFNQSTREARERPALLGDTAWRTRTAAALGTMQTAADELTTVGPVPPDMAAVADLFTQLARETQLLGEDYADGKTIHGGAADTSRTSSVTAATSRIADLVSRANREVRREG